MQLSEGYGFQEEGPAGETPKDRSVLAVGKQR